MSGCLSWREIEALADGAGDASAREHAAQCARCGRRLAAEMRYREAARALAGDSVPAVPEAVLAAVAAAKPSRPLSCRRIRRLLDLYLDGRLPARAAADFEAHLFTCRSCYEAYRQALDLRDGLASLAEAPPDGLQERVLSAVAATRTMAVPARPRQVATVRALAAAAAVVVLLIGAALWMRQPAPRPSRVTSLPRMAAAQAPQLPPSLPPARTLAPAPSTAPGLGLARMAMRPEMPRRERSAGPAVAAKAGSSKVPPSPVARPPVLASAQPSVPDRPVAAAAQVLEPPRVALAAGLTADSPARTSLPPPAAAPTFPATSATVADAPASVSAAAPTPQPSPAAAAARPEPVPAPAQPLRLVEATTDVTPRWLPVREGPTEHISPAPATSQTPLEAAAARVNEQLRQDDLAHRGGWIPLK